VEELVSGLLPVGGVGPLLAPSANSMKFDVMGASDSKEPDGDVAFGVEKTAVVPGASA